MVLDDGWVVKNKNDIKKEEVGKLIWFPCSRCKHKMEVEVFFRTEP